MQMAASDVSFYSIVLEGFRVVYDLKKPVGQRVVMLKALCSRCRVPRYEVVQKNKTYKVRWRLSFLQFSSLSFGSKILEQIFFQHLLPKAIIATWSVKFRLRYLYLFCTIITTKVISQRCRRKLIWAFIVTCTSFNWVFMCLVHCKF